MTAEELPEISDFTAEYAAAPTQPSAQGLPKGEGRPGGLWPFRREKGEEP